MVPLMCLSKWCHPKRREGLHLQQLFSTTLNCSKSFVGVQHGLTWGRRSHSADTANGAMVFLCCSAGELVKTFELTSDEIQLHRTMGSLNSEVVCARYNHNGTCMQDAVVSIASVVHQTLGSVAFWQARSWRAAVSMEGFVWMLQLQGSSCRVFSLPRRRSANA